MKLVELQIKNFGCIDEKGVTIKIDNIVVLIGPNNVGKTTVLKAYEAFRNSSAAQPLENFFQHSEENPIEIIGIFGEISEEDKTQIGTKWIYSDEDNENVIKYKWVWEKVKRRVRSFLGIMKAQSGMKAGWEDGIVKLQVVYRCH